ncbi:N-alpha-acetyltransferase 40-like isoform X2 [Dysidea avara]|uniref:N-alpha-acetyltransferase 40-like isoform X2 n=1 Tax=Dysidea avara TaxID=196820 RepID=UPI00331D1698
MGKHRSEKAKAKKEKLKQERVSTANSLALIKTAYAVDDPLEELFAFKSFRRNGLDMVISFHKMSSMTEDEAKWSFELLKTNMKEFYVRGGMGWKDREKWEELTHDNSCFLIAREKATSRPMAYTSYRYDMDEGVEVIYCYEIQLEPEVRRKGMGKFLMQILELIGHRTQMKKIILTVFKVCGAI